MPQVLMDRNPTKITATSTTAVKTFALDLLTHSGINSGVACLKVLTSGTVYFNVGEAPDTAINPGYTSSDNIAPLTFGSNQHGDGDIWYKASASSVAFAISF